MSTNKLGRGFDSLIPQNFDSTILASESEKIISIKIDDLVANPEQPRLIFNDEELTGLASSIKEHGILQPLVVTPNGQQYYIIAGERRWRAAKKAGLKAVPGIVRTTKQLQRLELALVENVQRVNLSPLEQAASIEYLHDQFSLNYDTIAKKLGKASTTIKNTARLIRLPEEVKQALTEKKITEGHARSILAIKDLKSQLQLLNLIISNGWSVRQAERFVTAQKEGAKTQTDAKKKVATTSPQTVRLTKVLNTPVSLRRTAKGGKLEISFKDDEELKRLTDQIASIN